MAKLNRIQTDFTWGEVSPRLLGRIDLAAYNKATNKMINAYPLIHGGVTRRPGTVFTGEVYNSAQKAKLIPFIYSTTQSYVLVFNGGKIEFITDGGFIQHVVSNYRIDSPYTEADLADLKYAQAGNIIFLVHPNHKPKQLERVSDTSWILSDIPFTYRAVSEVFFENFALDFKIIQGSVEFVKKTATTPGDTFTIVTDGTDQIFSLSYAGTGNGSLLQARTSAGVPAETWTVECTYVDSQRAEFTVTGSVSGSATALWKTGDYPSAVAFHEQRLFLAGTPLNPQHAWASKSGNYAELTIGYNDNDALAFQVNANSFDQIIHLVSARQMLPLTYSGEMSLIGGIAGITPTSIKVQPQTYHGTNNVRPIRIGSEVVVCQRDGRKLRAISYSVTDDANVAPDITMFAEHITGSGISDMTFAQDPDFVAWIVRQDGVLLSLTHSRQHETTGWARHTTEGLFEAITSIPSDVSDDVYMCVQRTIGGVTKRFIEHFDYLWDIYSDCSKLLTAVTAQTVWTGLGHLEGKTVDVVADGALHPQCVVTSGQITLQYAASVVVVGLHYDTTIELLHPELGTDAGNSSQGRKISMHEIILRLKDTVNCKVNGYEVPFRKMNDPLDALLPPFTGDKSIPASGWHSPNNIKIEQVTPMPFTLLAVIMKATVNE